MKGFALRLVLNQRHKRTRKWPIQTNWIMCKRLRDKILTSFPHSPSATTKKLSLKLFVPATCSLVWPTFMTSSYFNIEKCMILANLINHLLIREGEGNRQFWIGKVLDYLHSIQDHHQVKPYVPCEDRTETIVLYNSCLNVKTYSRFYWIMLCFEDKPLARLREKETLGKCVLLSDCPARQKNRFGTNNGTNHLFVYFCGGAVWEIDTIFISTTKYTSPKCIFPFPDYDWIELLNWKKLYFAQHFPWAYKFDIIIRYSCLK